MHPYQFDMRFLFNLGLQGDYGLTFFPWLFCLVLSVDAIDMSGKHEVDLHTNIWKVPPDMNTLLLCDLVYVL